MFVKYVEERERGEVLVGGRVVGYNEGVPILVSFAAELALKAWIFREKGELKIKRGDGHDLFALFDSLDNDVQQRLEGRSPACSEWVEGSVIFYPGLTETLCLNRRLFVEWRYVHERRYWVSYTGFLVTALSAIVQEYYVGVDAVDMELEGLGERLRSGEFGFVDGMKI